MQCTPTRARCTARSRRRSRSRPRWTSSQNKASPRPGREPGTGTPENAGLERGLALQPERGRRVGPVQARVARPRSNARRGARGARSDAVQLERDLGRVAPDEVDEAAGDLLPVRGVRESSTRAVLVRADVRGDLAEAEVQRAGVGDAGAVVVVAVVPAEDPAVGREL